MAALANLTAHILVQIGDREPVEVGTIEVPIDVRVSAAKRTEDTSDIFGNGEAANSQLSRALHDLSGGVFGTCPSGCAAKHPGREHAATDDPRQYPGNIANS